MYDRVIQVKFRLLNQPVLARGWTATLPVDTSPRVSVGSVQSDRVSSQTDWSAYPPLLPTLLYAHKTLMDKMRTTIYKHGD